MNRGKKQKSEYRKWNVSEEIQILKYMKELKERGVEVEKPTAGKYYTDMLAVLNIPNAGVIQIKNKVKNLKASYSSANQWTNQTGQGVDQGTVEGYVRKLCPHYDALDEIYGDRVSFCLPYYKDTLESNNDEQSHNNIQEHNENSSQITLPNDSTVSIVGIDWQNVGSAIGDNNVETTSGNIIRFDDAASGIENVIGFAGSDIIRPNESPVNIVEIDLQNIVDETAHEGVGASVDVDIDGSNDRINVVGQRQRFVGASRGVATINRLNINNRVVPDPVPRVNRDISFNRPFRLTSTGEGSNVSMLLQDGDICDDDEDETGDQHERISRFRNGLSSKPKSSKGFTAKPKPTGSNAASVMSTVMSQKADAMMEKNKIEQKKADDELFFKNQQLQINLEIVKERAKIEEKRVEESSVLKKAKLDLNVEKFKHQKEMEKNSMNLQLATMELKKAKMESKEKLAILELEKQERLEMFKMKLEYEKMNKGSNNSAS